MATMTQLDNSVVPKWNEEPSTLDAFEKRAILYVLGTKERGALPLRSKTFGTDGSRTTAVQSCQISCDDNTAGCRGWSGTGDCGFLRRALRVRPIQEAVRLFRQLMGLRDMRRQPGESMRKWTSRFEAFFLTSLDSGNRVAGV